MTPFPLVQRVDHVRRRVYLRALGTMALFGCAAGSSACASAPPAPATVAPDSALEARLVERSAPQHRLHVVFEWAATDPSIKMSGRGVLRLDRGERARLDLFGPRGETLIAAVVENDQMRIAPAFAAGMLPPASLMWSVLGVFRRPTDAPLTRTERASDGGVLLEYSRDGTRWRFRFVDDGLRSTEWTNGAGRRTAELSGSSSFGLPREVNFRDWAEFRELSLKVTEVEEKTSFEADVWILPGER